MNTLRKLTASAVAAAAILGGTIAAAAPAQAYSNTERTYILNLRATHDNVFYSDAYLLASGRYACQRKNYYHLGLQVGITRQRIINAVINDVNRYRYSNSHPVLARATVNYTFVSPAMPFGFC